MASSNKTRFGRVGGFAFAAFALAGLVGCDGIVGASETGNGSVLGGKNGTTGPGGTSTGPGGGGPESNDPGRVVMHRLNFSEYNNTVHDLLKTSIRLPDSFPPDDSAYGFDNVAEILSVTDVHLGHYQATAVALGSEALSPGHREAWVTCDLATQKEACVT